jgi:hypothetical protein
MHECTFGWLYTDRLFGWLFSFRFSPHPKLMHTGILWALYTDRLLLGCRLAALTTSSVNEALASNQNSCTLALLIAVH